MKHASWTAQARAHWKEHRPKAYRQMMADGTLEKALVEAANATSQEMQVLADQGFRQHEAWEAVRENHLFPPEERDASPRLPASPGYKAMRGFYRDLMKLRMPGEREDLTGLSAIL